MTENDDPAEAMQRLEQALERIARSARPVAQGAADSTVQPGAADGPAAADASELVVRVDALIARLRSAIGPQDV